VTKLYAKGRRTVPAVRDLSVVIRDGEWLAIQGRTGHGKSTLLNLLGMLDRPTSGTIEMDGKDLTRLPGTQASRLRAKSIGFIFQTFNLVQVLSVFQNVEFPLLLQGGLTRKAREGRVRALLQAVGLAEHVRHRPSELSGGQRQRVAVARALVTRPALVLADEPTANLDSQTGGNIIDLMKEMNRRDGTTFIFSTHDPKVMAHATAIVRIADGQVAGREAGAAAASGGR
jgi:putative ABC transport system ATP-binding protein